MSLIHGDLCCPGDVLKGTCGKCIQLEDIMISELSQAQMKELLL
jgi:hypothetical protein